MSSRFDFSLLRPSRKQRPSRDKMIRRASTEMITYHNSESISSGK